MNANALVTRCLPVLLLCAACGSSSDGDDGGGIGPGDAGSGADDGGDDGDNTGGDDGDGTGGDGGDDGDSGDGDGSDTGGDDGETGSGDDGDDGSQDGPPPEGVEVWRWAVPNSETRGIDVGGGLAYVAARNGMIYGLDAETGTESWSYNSGSLVTSNTPLYTGDYLFVAGSNAAIALDPATGAEIWKLPATPYEITFDGSHIYFLNDEAVSCVDVSGPSIEWETPVGGGAHVPARIAIAGGKACGQLYDGGVFCLDAATGQQLWSKAFQGTFVSPSLDADGERLFTRSKVNIVRALDTADGSTIWENTDQQGNTQEGCGVIRRGDKIAYANSGSLALLETSDGSRLWTSSLPGMNSGAEPVFGSGLVYFVSPERLVMGQSPTNMRVMAFDMDTGNKAWEQEVDDPATSANVAGTPAYEGSSLFAAVGAVAVRFD